ncbi:hypothetical protein FRC11_002234, partial [Ceratobasidium sp. 423]
VIVQQLKKIVCEYREAHVSTPETRSPQSPIERQEPTPLNLHALRTAFEPTEDVDLVSTPVLDPLKTPASPPRKSSLALPFTRADPPPHSKLVPVSMPMHHGPLTRALVNTMGRIGRWKRGLGTRSMLVPTTGVGCVDPGAFDSFGFGLSGGGYASGTEVVAVRGGVEEYLRTKKRKEVEDADGNDLTVRPGAEARVLDEEGEKGRDTPTSTSTPRLLSQFPPAQNEEHPAEETGEEGEGSSLRRSRRASDPTQMQLYAHTLRESCAWLSESEIVRRPPRRLPNRRDLEFAAAEFSAARTDSVSSLGAPSTVSSVRSALSASDPTTPDHTGGPIQAWQIDFPGEESDDDLAPGDAEAALQRLEGQIDAEEQRIRDLKVDKWLKRVQDWSEQLVGCIPFLGEAFTRIMILSNGLKWIYLSELSEYAKLPDFIDPTRPEEPVHLDPTIGEFGPLADPEVFNTLPELPDYMSLRPLINIHKQ